ncbi:hypothetical protein BS47DRAFT_1481178 [Hydnum rufescens UP504]|uniref:Aminoglycoside phosphotransferase domain-containing protein n=1 Tax=Hydnum rufescens UP504 TaxID=1448309 RepID=A0A9P6BBM1_9AGAM|nr:hypothetical protein BS47DRAFT_1481178 [Hydnum rufescens UP504]
MSSNLPFYNYLGGIEYVPGYPLSFGDWSSLTEEVFPTEQQSLLLAISRILSKSPAESHVRAQDLNLTLEVGFDDGFKVIARKILPRDNIDEEQLIQKLRAEACLLQWLANCSSIPAPRVLFPEEDRYRDFIIMDKLPGAMLLNMYSTLDTLAKERLVESFANVALDLFGLDVPQRIGTFFPDISSKSFDVIPRIGIQRFKATRVFNDIQEYLAFLFEMKSNSPVIGGDDGGHIDELRRHVDGVLAGLLSETTTSNLFRCVLVHNDLNEMNILVDEDGNITGVIDWEYQTLQPAILAADYPPWLSYDDCSDPRFADHKQTFWLDSPEESERLRDLYTRIVKSKHHDYWKALIQGARLRSCVKWLLNLGDDPGCRRMRQWMDATFGGSCCE